MSERTESQRSGMFISLVNFRKYSVALFVFLVGYFVYFVTLEKEGFFFELIHHVGLFVSAVVVVHFVYELLVKRYERAIMVQEIADATAQTTDKLFPAFKSQGFIGFSDNLGISDVFDSLQSGDELLWLDTYAPSRHVVVPALIAALERNVDVRMLAVAPHSEVCKLRASEITLPGFTENDFTSDLCLFTDAMQAASESSANPDRFQLRLYSDLPCIPMYIRIRNGVPLSGLTSFYLNKPSEYFSHIQWGYAERGMLAHFVEYFNLKWSKAVSYSLEARPNDDGITPENN